METRDLVLAGASKYQWHQLQHWAITLRKVYDGKVVVILYDANPTIEAKLAELNIEVRRERIRTTVWNQRFEDFSKVISEGDYRYAVVTDIRDVVFQSDPFVWLEGNLSKPLYAVSEGMRYRDEPWNAKNLTDGYPTLAHRAMDKTVYNVGVLAGHAANVGDICLAVGIIAKSSGFNVADQSGFNILLDMKPYADTTQFGLSEDGFACQAGTMVDPSKIARFRPFLLEPEPILTEHGVTTASGKLYPVVHQYDRVPAWQQYFDKLCK